MSSSRGHSLSIHLISQLTVQNLYEFIDGCKFWLFWALIGQTCLTDGPRTPSYGILFTHIVALLIEKDYSREKQRITSFMIAYFVKNGDTGWLKAFLDQLKYRVERHVSYNAIPYRLNERREENWDITLFRSFPTRPLAVSTMR